MSDTIAHPSPSLGCSTSVHGHHQPQFVDQPQTISYLISTVENDLGRVCWEIKDSENRLIFKSCKELTQTEIVESIQDLSGESLWSIHRPIRGWYLALRSPKDSNSHNFIALEPRNVTKGQSRMAEFVFRLKASSFVGSSPVDKPVIGPHKPPSLDSSIKRRHPSISYSSPKSPDQSTSGHASSENELHHSPVESVVVRLRPVEEDPKQQSIFKSFSHLFLNTNQRMECFIDSSIFPASTIDLPAKSLANAEISEAGSSESTASPKKHQERLVLFDYEDQNSVFGIQNNGILKLHLKNSRKLHLLDDGYHLNHLGFHQAFWVAVCIAYLGFRADQDAYMAAMQGD